jgi:hypothetical protein
LSVLSRVVPDDFQHRHLLRGDASMKKNQKYAATYEIGQTKIHVVAPPPMSEEEKEEILRSFHLVGWSILEEMGSKEDEQGS